MNVTRDSVAPAMKAAAEDSCGPYIDIFSNDTRDLMGFFVVLRRLLVECGIHDFTLQDLFKPERPRLVRIFSYIINFIRFRESQTAVIDEHFNRTEHTKQRIEQLYGDNQAAEDHLRDLESNRQAAETAIQRKEARISELKDIIKGMKHESDRLGEQHERMRAEQQRMKAVLEDRMTQGMATKQAAEKLRPYTEQSPAALEASLQDLSSALSSDRAQIESLDRRARALQTSTDAFNTVAADVRACTNVLGELQRDINAEEEMLAAADRGRDALSERSNNVRDIEWREQRLQKQLENVQARTEKLRRNAEERRQMETAKMEELKRTNEEIRRERGESGREMERRRVRIEQTEKKVRLSLLLPVLFFETNIQTRWPISRKTSRTRSMRPTTSTSRWRATSGCTYARWTRVSRRPERLCLYLRVYAGVVRRNWQHTLGGVVTNQRSCNVQHSLADSQCDNKQNVSVPT